MSHFATNLPTKQQANRAGCLQQRRTFIEFKKDDIEQSIPDSFERQVEKYPDRLAVRSRKHAFTYETLNRMANQIARAILARSGRGQEPVALFLENDAPMIAAMLGALKAGKIYVPLDPSLPSARLAHILEDSQASLVLTGSRHREFPVGDGQSTIEWIDLDRLLDEGLASENVRLPIAPDALTWILYTSGSTGHPKGVVQSHRNVLHYVRNYTNHLGLSAEDRLSLLFSFGVNGAAHEIFSSLLNGACLYPLNIGSEGLSGLAPWLIQHEVTTYCSVPTVFRQFCELLSGKEEFPKLRLIKMIGEPVLARDVELYRKHFSDECIFINRFGSTETGIVRWNFIDKKTAIEGNSVPIGYAVEDNETLILNEAGEIALPGEVGEIAVKSPYLSPGYWRRPELTEKAFSAAPGGDGGRMYRTGDLGRLLPDGAVLHLGRKDFQVKILGHRVELAEIEAALLNVPGIKEAVVMAREDRHGEPRLVAYVRAREGRKATPGELRRALAAVLPSHMIPSIFVLLESFPLAPNGKVNRGALPQPDWIRPELETVFVSPRTPAENTLAKIWAGVLGIDRVGVDDNFLELGGNSLLAMRLFVEVEKTFGKKLPLSNVLQAPTIAQMARVLCQEGESSPWSSLVAIQPNGLKPPFVWVHGENSNAFLPRYLGPDQPLYGLVHQGQDGKRLRYTRMEDIAAHYLKEVLTVQPEGPYFLGGFCIGGALAFEVAHQLQKQGREIALLVLLDPPHPAARSMGSKASVSLSRLTQWFGEIRRHARKLASLGAREKLTYVFEEVRWRFKAKTARIREKLIEMREKLAYRIYLFAGCPLPPALQNRYRAEMYWRAQKKYAAQPYPGRIIILRSAEGGHPAAASGWERLAAGGIEIHEVPGHHNEIVFKQPQIEGLAKHLKACLAKAQDEERGATEVSDAPELRL